MAGSSRFSIEAVISMIDRVSGPMKNASGSVGAFSNKAKGHFGGVGSAFSRTGSIMSGIIGANLLQGASISIMGFADRAISLASDLTEVQNVVDTTFGKSSKIVDDWSKTAITQFGLSELQAKKFNGTMGAMLKSSGLPIDNLAAMSTKLSGLAGDFASFYNLDGQEAFDKIRSGISGETEPLKQLGINMSVANLSAYALTQGINKQFKDMTQGEQVMLRYNYLLNSSKDAQGDFAKTLMTSYANQKRVFSTNFDQMLARIATQILPDLTNGIITLNEWITSVDAKKIGEDIKFVAKTIWSFRYAILAVVGAFAAYRLIMVGAMVATKGLVVASAGLKILQTIKILGFVDGIKYLTLGTKAATVAQWLFNTAILGCPIFWIIAAIIALVAIVVVAIKYWDSFGAALLLIMGPVGLFISALKNIYDRWNDITNAFQTGGILEGFKMIGKVILDAVLYPIQQVLELISNIPVIGGLAGGAAAQIQGFRENSLGAKPSGGTPNPNYASPQSGQMIAGTNTSGNIDINVNVPKGAASVSQRGSLPAGTRLNKGQQ